MTVAAENIVSIPGSWDRVRSSRAFKTAEARSGFAAICVVGTFDRQRRGWSDNQGVHPTRLVVTTGDPMRAADVFNRGVHSVGAIYHTQALVYMRSREHAERARDWIEHQVRAEPLLNGWSDLEVWQWEIMFSEAASALGMEIFDETERARRIWAIVRKGG